MSARRLVAWGLICLALALTAAGLASRGVASRVGATGALLAAEDQAGGGNEPRNPELVPKKLAYAAELPDSAGRGVAQRWCLMCHSAMLITQQAKDSAAWEKTLAQMEKWGVAATPEEHDTLRAYLIRNFGPRLSGPR